MNIASKKEKEQLEETLKILKKDTFAFVLFIVVINLFLILNFLFDIIEALTHLYSLLLLSIPFSLYLIYTILKKNKQYSCIYDCNLKEDELKEKILLLSFTNINGQTKTTPLKMGDTKNIRLLRFFSKTKGELEVTYRHGIRRFRVFGKEPMKKLSTILKNKK